LGAFISSFSARNTFVNELSDNVPSIFIGQIVATFNENECANYFKNAGYASVKT